MKYLNEILIEWDNSHDNIDGPLNFKDVKHSLENYLDINNFHNNIYNLLIKDNSPFRTIEQDHQNMYARINAAASNQVVRKDFYLPVSVENKKWWNHLPDNFFSFLNSVLKANKLSSYPSSYNSLLWIETLLYTNLYIKYNPFRAIEDISKVYDIIDDKISDEFISRVFKTIYNKGYWKPTFNSCSLDEIGINSDLDAYMLYVEGITETNEHTWAILRVPLYFSTWENRWELTSIFTYFVVTR